MKHIFIPLLILCLFASLLNAQTRTGDTEIKPGSVWLDANGERINAHGGCVIFHQGIYYWYGEEKVKGLSEKEHADGGIHCYTSDDLIDWHDQGMVLSLVMGDTLSNKH